MFSFVIVLSAFVCYSQAYSAVSIPSRWLNYGHNQYYVDPVFKGNFYAAVEFCEQNQMELLAVESQGELDAVSKFVKGLSGTKVESYWTSGSRLSNDKDYVWLSTGTKVSIVNWGAGEPNNSGGNQKCLQLYVNYYKNGGIYDDLSCDAKIFAICSSKARIIRP